MSMLSVRLIQANLVWENKKANLEHLQRIIHSSDQHADIIVLPEMFSSGFSMSAESLAESMEGESVQWMKDLASERSSVICGSLIIEDKGFYYNRFVWMEPDGSVSSYDKRHLFTHAHEEKHYTRGEQRVILEYKSWKICPLICYDLRFPVWSRNDCDYDLLIYVANWPSPRAHAWKNLLISRAIENQCYTIGVNRVGTDANGLKYLGDSCVVNFNGQVLQQISQNEVSIFEELEKNEMLEFRKKLNFLADRDKFSVNTR